MPSPAEVQALVELSRELGRPELDYVILGEGNTSAACADGTFWVKASGSKLATASPESFVRVERAKVLAMLESTALPDEIVHERLLACRVGSFGTTKPSVETLLHAVCLALPGVHFVGHTHPVAVNQLLCSRAFPEVFAGRIFPDEIVVCGPAPVLVPYVDPGIPLARAVHEKITHFVAEHGRTPRVVLMQNHGLVVLGTTAAQVRDATAMMVKTARILAGACAAGGPSFLTKEAVARIDTRPDELYRKQKLGG